MLEGYDAELNYELFGTLIHYKIYKNQPGVDSCCLICNLFEEKMINFSERGGMLKKNLYICGRKVATKLQYIRIN
jgi:hypothetical protein